MKTINSLSEIMELAECGNLYVRWSRGPEMDMAQGRSRDYLNGGSHAGLSCQPVNADYSRNLVAQMLVEYVFLRRKDSEIYGWLFTASENGRDSDNAPTVDAATIKPVARLDEGLVQRLVDYSVAYWTHMQTGAKQYGRNWSDYTPKLSDYLEAS